jgi:hypothetical protein
MKDIPQKPMKDVPRKPIKGIPQKPIRWEKPVLVEITKGGMDYGKACTGSIVTPGVSCNMGQSVV